MSWTSVITGQIPPFQARLVAEGAWQHHPRVQGCTRQVHEHEQGSTTMLKRAGMRSAVERKALSSMVAV